MLLDYLVFSYILMYICNMSFLWHVMLETFYFIERVPNYEKRGGFEKMKIFAMEICKYFE